MQFGTSISMGMAKARMRRKDTAKALGISVNYLHKLCEESSDKKPSLDLLMSMCELFDVKLSVFISWSEPSYNI